MALSSHIERSNAQCINTPTISIVPTTAVFFHGLNCFGHMVYLQQTSMHQNMAKLLTHYSIYMLESVLNLIAAFFILDACKSTDSTEMSPIFSVDIYVAMVALSS